MEMCRRLLLTMLLGGFALAALVSAQNQSGFISLDCGLPGDSPPYTEATTGINYESDAGYVETGIGSRVQPEFEKNWQKQMWNLRIFPDGVRNCYRLNLTRGDRYLIRASFLYGNYDGKNTTPKFDLYLGPSLWSTVTLVNASAASLLEIIHVLSSDDLYVCLVNTGSGTPFISALELRLLRNDTYVTQTGSLESVMRLDMGSTTGKTYRYKDDVYDRAWTPSNFNNWNHLTTNLPVDANRSNIYQPAPAVMSSAVEPVNKSEPLDFFFRSNDTNSQFYVYMHFAEVRKLKANESRLFNISVNRRHWFGPIAPDYLRTTTVFSRLPFSGEAQYIFSIFKTGRSTHRPIINALEVYRVKELLQSQTDKQDVNAITNIKSFYKLKKNWQGDPCTPQAFIWEGVNCIDGSDDPPRITSLNLSSTGLTGGIPLSLINLTMITSLDLSNNNLTGTVPNFLSQMTSLNYLNLERNKLSGSLPTELIEKRDNGSLTLRVNGNPDLCPSISCKKKNKITIPAVTSAAAFFILITVLIGWWTLRRRKQKDRRVDGKSIKNSTYDSMEWNSRQFSYSDILKITNNFEKVLGKGGFGTVYQGYMDNSEVAVKMLSASSVQGYKQFQAEVKLLLRVHHRNLTTLVGYCDDATNMALIYEYMANGNLGDHLSDGSKHILSWEERLQIAVEAAQGLEYLHHGCKPPIVHRDVKSTNILLNDKLEGKLADFGLSRTFPIEGVSHVSTIICGTPGYLDPEYYLSNRLTEKSDVYSFGVVLLEIITGRPVISKSLENENTHISQWVCSMISKGDIRNTVDPRLKGDFDINCAWKAVEIGMLCVSSTSTRRPTMNHVVMELKECLATEISRKKEGSAEYERKDFAEMTAVNNHSEESPLAR